jgi:hypothetical protein
VMSLQRLRKWLGAHRFGIQLDNHELDSLKQLADLVPKEYRNGK